MAIYKICPRCRNKYQYGESCSNGCYEKQKREGNREYDRTSRKNSEIYNSTSWKRIRTLCFNKHNYLCLWNYFKHKKISKAEMIHHIVEIDDDPGRAYDLSNLIPLSDEAHREIHMLYKKDKAGTQRELFEMIKVKID